MRMRRFDPRAVGRYECRAWETYYRRKWAAFLIASVALVRAAFRMSWPKTLYGAWLVLRANMLWAPVPDNDPDGARRTMARFYRLLNAKIDPVKAAELEVEWWRAHRENQYGDPPLGTKVPGLAPSHALGEALIVALRDLYAYTYGEPPERVRRAAELRAQAMDVSDRWIEAGKDPEHPLLREERALLVRSYAALLAAVYR
jgi:hypothetical protein